MLPLFMVDKLYFPDQLSEPDELSWHTTEITGLWSSFCLSLQALAESEKELSNCIL